jgi:hypothetical protein
MKKFILGIALGLLLLFPTISYARLGVGVGTGKIQVDENLYPGVIYKLPAITVINTGDETSKYEVVVSQREKQEELKPNPEWISYSPEKFELEPEKLQLVEVTLDLPITAKPGNYFAFLEAHPYQEREGGTSSVGIAAAAKLYFTVKPANVIMGIYYKIISWWKVYAPWSNIITSVVVAIIAWNILKRFVNIDVSFRKKSKGTKEEEE